MKSYSATRTCQRVAGGGGRRVAAFRLRFLFALGVLLILKQDVVQTVEAAVQTKAGRILMLMSSTPGGHDTTQYYLQTDDNQFYRLAFCNNVQVEEIIPNTRVVVEYDQLYDGGVLSTCKLPQQETSRRLLFGDTITTPTKPTFLIYLVTLCGYNESAAATEQEIYDWFFNSSSSPVRRTFAGYYKTCSYGQVRVERPQIKVVGPIRIPCNGDLGLPFIFPTGNEFDTQSCQGDNLLKWHYYADSTAAQQKIVPSDYHHKIMILPKGYTRTAKGCNGITGAASVGPWIRPGSGPNNWGTGIVWVAGDEVTESELLFHEIGHTLGMAHADIVGGCSLIDQCDSTCPMGTQDQQGIRCLNAPHNWQLGWDQPATQFTEQDLGTWGMNYVVNIPLQSSRRRTAVTVALRAFPANQKVWISARMNSYPYDLPFNKSDDGKPFVVLHTFAGTESNSYQRTTLLSILDINSTYTDSSTGLTIRFLKYDRYGALVYVCRKRAATEVNCDDMLDDDCDGVEDREDTDCPTSICHGISCGGSPPPSSPNRVAPPPPPIRVLPPSPNRKVSPPPLRSPPSPRSPPPSKPPPSAMNLPSPFRLVVIKLPS